MILIDKSLIRQDSRDRISKRMRYLVPVLWNSEDIGVFFAVVCYFHPVVLWRVFRFGLQVFELSYYSCSHERPKRTHVVDENTHSTSLMGAGQFDVFARY